MPYPVMLMSTSRATKVRWSMKHPSPIRPWCSLIATACVAGVVGACDKTFFRDATDDDYSALPVFGISPEDNTSALILDVEEYGPSPSGWCISIQTTGGAILSVDEAPDHACITVPANSWANFIAPVSYPALSTTTMPLLLAELSPGPCFSVDAGNPDGSSRGDQERWFQCGAGTPTSIRAWPPQPVVAATDAGVEAGSSSAPTSSTSSAAAGSSSSSSTTSSSTSSSSSSSGSSS
jgi:hypothetical protein